MIYLRAKFHVPDSNGSLTIAIKPKDEYRFHAATILLCNMLRKKSLNKKAA
jgi:hypothetical protein